MNEMRTWEEIAARLQARYQVVASGDRSICLTWQRASHRPITVFVHNTTVLGQNAVAVLAELGPASEVDIHAALGEALRLPVGSLVRREDTIALRHLLRGRFDAAQLDETVDLLAAGVLGLARHLAATRGASRDARVFEMFSQ